MTLITPNVRRISPMDLQNGDRMTREEFHRAYAQVPEHFKAELIGGTVYVASPLRLPHGTAHPFLSAVLCAYMAHTKGTELGDNTTVLLGEDAEPQPDLFLRVLPEYGGRSKTSQDEYVDGAPELVIEIAHSSYAIDLHAKRVDYTRYGVLEYLVYTVKDNRLRWFDLVKGEELIPDAGVCRIRTFPGLWIDVEAIQMKEYERLVATLNQGLATPEHAAFVEQLAKVRG